MIKTAFSFKESATTVTPQLVINRTLLLNNIKHLVNVAGLPSRLWPHVKTHKTAAIVSILQENGINNFKTATIAEAEMCASCRAENVLLSYPLVGYNQDRFLKLQKAFPSTIFHTLFDDLEQLRLFDKKCESEGTKAKVMIDVNSGMNRTGRAFCELSSFASEVNNLKNVTLSGFHCYDGQRHEKDAEVRKVLTEETYLAFKEAVASLIKQDTFLIMGGTPSFPFYAKHEDVSLSPGTLVLNDAGYSENYKDLNFAAAAAVLTRVVSAPCKGQFTLDLGCKGLASDPRGDRGRIIGLDNCEELFQSEEHWVFRMKEGHEAEAPKVGDELFVIPMHICPTSALYPFSLVVENNELVAKWEITSRNRRIAY